MSKKLLRGLLTASLLCGAFMSTGCLVNSGPQMGVLGVPIPVSPMIQVNKENQFWEHERYGRVPILGPLTAGPLLRLSSLNCIPDLSATSPITPSKASISLTK